MGAVFERLERMRRLVERWGLSLFCLKRCGIYYVILESSERQRTLDSLHKIMDG